MDGTLDYRPLAMTSRVGGVLESGWYTWIFKPKQEFHTKLVHCGYCTIIKLGKGYVWFVVHCKGMERGVWAFVPSGHSGRLPLPRRHWATPLYTVLYPVSPLP